MSISTESTGQGLTRTRQVGPNQTFVSLPGEGPIPQVISGATLPEVNVPASVVAGDTFQVNGTVGFDCLPCAFDRAIRVALEVSGQQTQFSEEFSLLGKGGTEQFSFTVPAPQTPGEPLSVRLLAQRNPPDPLFGWQTDNTAGPFTVNVLSQQEKTQQQVTRAIPWVVGGGAIGAGAARLSERSTLAGGLAGVGVGTAAYTLLGSDFGFDLTFPDFPTTAVLATALLLGGGALLLSQLPELDFSLPSRERLPSPSR